MEDITFPVIYFTGAPATGKTTIVDRLRLEIPTLCVFSYGAELTRFLQRKGEIGLTQDILRAKSAGIATNEDIELLDTELLAMVAQERFKRPVVIDSHAVTKESYGFRVTPFSMARLKELRPTRIIVLYTAPEVTIERIANDPGGRPMVTEFESGFHTGLQAMVAINYAIGVGLPVHFLDSDRDLDVIVGWIRERIQI